MDEWITELRALLTEARTMVRAGHVEQGLAQYGCALDRVRAHGDDGETVRTLLECGVQFVLHGRLEDGMALVDEAGFLAIEASVPIDQGTVALVHGKVLVGQGDSEAAQQMFLRAAAQFRADGRFDECALATSCYAFEVEILGKPEDAIAAHRKAIAAAGEVPALSDDGNHRMGIHLECIAMNQLSLRQLPRALGAFRRARAHWEATGAEADVARCNVGIGDIYFRQGNVVAAKSSFELARRSFMANRDYEAVAALHVTIRQLDEMGRSGGPELS